MCCIAYGCLGHVHAVEMDVTPVSAADGIHTQVTVAGRPVWQNTGSSSYLYGRRPNSFSFTSGQTLYARVTYYDDGGGGTIRLHFDSQTAAYTPAALHTRTSRVGTMRFVDCYFELPQVLFNKRQNNSSDFRLVCGDPGEVYVSVARITLSDTPFADPDFQLAVSRAWQTRYTGPAKDYVDATTLKGKVMTGYQGWFGTPNDIADTGIWKHWVKNNAMTAENFTIDMWPDLTEYDPASLALAGDVVTASGAPAYLFSSRSYPAVQKHFRWMRKHNIDGAWLQRFNPKAGTDSEWVLRNVSQAAAEEGLIWGVEYDVSGMADATVAAKLQADWEWLTTQFDLLNDPRYVHEDGKPVVFIWGLAVPDRGFSTASANAVVDYFRAQGVHIIGGLPSQWNSLDSDWQNHMAKYDGVLVWMNTTPSDSAFFRNRGQDFYPHIWPGFSWAHLKQMPASSAYTNREGGQFYWDKGRDSIKAGGADRLFVGMFDEYDEGTAIAPMTDNPPDSWQDYGRFLNNQGKPADWWMMLTDELKRMMYGQRIETGTLPDLTALANRSNIGPEAFVDLGVTDATNSLSRMQLGDGDTVVETVGGRECRGNKMPTTDRYMYFNVENAFAYQLTNGDVTIEIEYFDSLYGSDTGTVLGLQYDAASDAYTSAPQSITTTGSDTWRTVRFELSDALLGDRQDGGADFRLSFGDGKLHVNRVWVRLPEGKTYPFTWTHAIAGQPLNWSQNANWLGGIVGQSDPTSQVKFFPNQTMPGGAISISNDTIGLQLATLQLGGIGSSTAGTTVDFSGNALSLGGAAPAIMLDATQTAFDLAYDISTPITLSATTLFAGAGDATFRISGAISGAGGITKTGGSAVALAGASTFTGGVTLQAGCINLDSPGVPGISGPLGNGGTFTINGGTLDNTSGSAKVLANLNPVVVNGDFQFSTASGTSANNLSLPGSVDLGGSARTINTQGAADLTLTGIISHGALIKNGSGKLILAAANSYTGTTSIRDGALVLNMGANRLTKTGNIVLGATGSSGKLILGGTTVADQTLASLATSGGGGGVAGGNTSVSALTLNLASNVTFSGNLGGAAPLENNLSLIKVGSSDLILSGTNTYSGGTTIHVGRLFISSIGALTPNGTVQVNSSGGLCLNANGTPTYNQFITLASGARLAMRKAATLTNLILPSSGSVTFNSDDQNTVGFTLNRNVALTGDLTIQVGGAAGIPGAVTLAGTISGSAGLIKTQTGTLVLSGARDYSGNTTINAGLLRLTQASIPENANPSNDASTITISSTGATLDLTYNGTDKVAMLFIGSIRKAQGVYGKSGSISPVIGIPQITGSGTLTVGNPVFSSWITGTFINGQVPGNQRGTNDDFDKDGIGNLIEYAIASQDPTAPNATIGSFTGNALSFTKRAVTSGLTYAIQQSTDLTTWTEVTGGSYVNDATTISFPLTPDTSAKKFLRLQVRSD